MATIENFLLRFKVEGQGAVDKASSGIKNLSDQVAGFGANTGPLNNALSGILGKLGPIGLAAGAAGGAFAALGLQAINLAAGISDIAGATGIAEGTLLNFRTSVIEAGGSADEFGSIAAKLNQNVQNAASGNEKLQKAFKDLGVFVTDAGGKVRSTESILRDITVRFQQGSLSSAEYSAAVDLLGKNITKLDLGKLSAIADPVKDVEIQKLDKYAEAIDRVRDGLERGLLSFFGSAALELERVLAKFNQAKASLGEFLPPTERELNLQGQTRIPPFSAASLVNRDIGNRLGSEDRFGGLIVPRELTESEKIIFNIIEERRKSSAELLENEKKMAELMKPYKSRAGVSGGGFGAADPERLKREAEQRRKEGERAADALAKELQTIKDMTAGYQRATQANMDRYTTQVDLLGKSEYEQQLIRGTAEIEKKYGDQIAALEAKKATAKKETLVLIQQSIDELEGLKTSEQDIFEITAKQTFEYRQQEESLKRIGEEFNRQIQSQETLNNIMKNINQQQSSRDFEKTLTGLSPLRQQIAKINEEAKKMATEAGNAFAATFEDKGFLTPEEAQELSDGLSQIAQGYKNIADDQIKSLGVSKEYMEGFANISEPGLKALAEFREEFILGTKDAFENFKDNAMDAGKQAANSFNNFTSGMEDAFVKFAETGKLSFKSLANSIIADLVRIAVRRAIVAAVGGPLGMLFGGGRSAGGSVAGGTSYVVGERGPELFVPQSAGKIISNSALKGSGSNTGGMGGGGQTTVNYNIQAVDAASFRSLVAKDPSFIYAVTEQGRRSQPTRSR
jgi:hypothetical protein